MRGLILAAGRGRRMGEITKEKPKCLIKIAGITLLERQIMAFNESGITDIAIVTGYRSESLKTYKLVEFHNPNWKNTQMFRSLLCASDWLKHDNCIVSYSDIFYGSNILSKLQRSNSDVAVAYDPKWEELWAKRFDTPLLDAESFKMDNDKFVVELGNKVKSASEIQGQYMGLIYFTREGWNKLISMSSQITLQMQDEIHMTDILNRAILAGAIKIKAVSNEEDWGEIDSESDLSLYSREFPDK